MKALIKVTNDTIAVKNVSGLPAVTTPKSTLGLVAQTSSHTTSTPFKGHFRKFGTANKCYVCQVVKGEFGKHATGNCPDYPTAKDRRWVLMKAKVCPYCTKKIYIRGTPKLYIVT